MLIRFTDDLEYNWDNPINLGLRALYHANHNHGRNDVITGAGVNSGSIFAPQSTLGKSFWSNGFQINYENVAYIQGVAAQEYTFINVMGGMTSSDGAFQDMDDFGTYRIFQNRMRSSVVQFIPFDTSGTNGLAASSMTLTAEEKNTGFVAVSRIGSDKIPRVDVKPFYGRAQVSNAGSAMANPAKAINNQSVISVFAGNIAGGGAIVGTFYWWAVAFRCLSQAEVDWICHNPFGIFRPKMKPAGKALATAAGGARSRAVIIQ